MKKIGILGTFDVANYGDLLFPLVAQRRLEMLLPVHVSALSPVGGSPLLPDCFPPRPLEEMDQYDGLLIGGGNVIRMSAATLDEYQRDAASMAGYSMLWASTTNIAAKGRPVCWNAPGVPEPFPDYQYGLVRSALHAASYLSVRDDESRALLLAAWPEAQIEVVPDTAWDIPLLWTPKELDDAYRKIVDGRAERTIAIHLNERYLGLSDSGIAACLDKISKDTGAKLLLLGLGPCHEDDKLARRIGKRLGSDPIIVENPNSLRETAACISRSSAYLGSSMHGFITAAAFGVPALNVASQLVRKFAGLQHLLGADTICVETWTDARAWVASYDGQRKDRFAERIVAITSALDDHWKRIATELDNPKPARVPEIEDLNGQIIAATLRDLVQRYRTQQKRLKALQNESRSKWWK